MKVVVLSIFLMAMSASINPNIVVIGTPRTPVEKHVISHFEQLWRVNKAAGDAGIRHIPDKLPYLSSLTRVIAKRISVDLANVYRLAQDDAQESYSFLAERDDGREYVFVVRLRNVKADGSFVLLEGLIYSIEAGAIVSVTPTRY